MNTKIEKILKKINDYEKKLMNVGEDIFDDGRDLHDIKQNNRFAFQVDIIESVGRDLAAIPKSIDWVEPWVFDVMWRKCWDGQAKLPEVRLNHHLKFIRGLKDFLRREIAKLLVEKECVIFSVESDFLGIKMVHFLGYGYEADGEKPYRLLSFVGFYESLKKVAKVGFDRFFNVESEFQKQCIGELTYEELLNFYSDNLLICKENDLSDLKDGTYVFLNDNA